MDEYFAKLAKTNYQLFASEKLQDLAMKYSEDIEKDTLRLRGERDKYKDIHEETSKGNKIKVDRKIRENESIPIKKLQG